MDPKNNLKGFIFRYKNKDWTIQEDKEEEGKRVLILEMFPNHRSKVTYDEQKKVVTFQGHVIEDPEAHILFSRPVMKIKVVVLKTKSDEDKPIATIAQESPTQIVERLCGALELNKRKDIECIENNEIARSLYENALSLTPDCPVALYLKKRGLEGNFPESFRYLPNVYHPWLQRRLPALLVPLRNSKGALVGVNKVFCNHDGSMLPRKRYTPEGEKKFSTKLTSGQTLDAAAEVYQATIAHKGFLSEKRGSGVVLISEGPENALTAAQSLEFVARFNLQLAHRLYSALGITDAFSIRTCVGINSIMGTPLDLETHTVVILADPDLGKDAKTVMRLTVESFLLRKLKVKIVVPNQTEFATRDLNDILREIPDKQKKYEQIAEIIAGATDINDLTELSSDDEPLQNSVSRLNKERESLRKKPEKESFPHPGRNVELSLDLVYEDTLQAIKAFRRR